MSEVGRKCLVLAINVVYHSRALPIAWIVVKGSKGHFPEDTHVKLVQKVHASRLVFMEKDSNLINSHRYFKDERREGQEIRSD